jgi:hypothetical protein
MNGLLIDVSNAHVTSFIYSDPIFGPSSNGKQSLLEQDAFTVSAGQWNDLVVSRQGTSVTIYLDGTALRTLSIPSYFESTNISIGIGVDSHSGESPEVDYLEYRRS